MYKDGYKNITNIDYSKIVIDNMAERCKDMPEMKCKRENREFSENIDTAVTDINGRVRDGYSTLAIR